MRQKRLQQGYLFDRIFPITHRKLVEVFEVEIFLQRTERLLELARQDEAAAPDERRVVSSRAAATRAETSRCRGTGACSIPLTNRRSNLR